MDRMKVIACGMRNCACRKTKQYRRGDYGAHVQHRVKASSHPQHLRDQAALKPSQRRQP